MRLPRLTGNGGARAPEFLARLGRAGVKVIAATANICNFENQISSIVNSVVLVTVYSVVNRTDGRQELSEKLERRFVGQSCLIHSKFIFPPILSR